MTATAETAAVHPFPQIDPDDNQLILCVGRKGSGKSVNAREMFLAWPAVDKLVVDPTGDADPGAGALTVHKIPDQLPTRRDGAPTIVRYIANPASPTYQDDLDRALGLALFPKTRRTLTWVDEAGEVFPNPTGPNGGTLLRQSRHWNASAIMCCPRPITINPLCLAQADRVVVYDLPNPADRDRVANAIGWPPKRFAAECDNVRARGPHWFLTYVAKEHQLYLCPPMPMTSSDKKAGT